MGRSVEPKTPHVKSGLEYAKKVVGGKISACRWVVLACKRHLDDLQKSISSPKYPFEFDPQSGERVCRFIENLPHVKGEWAKRGELLVLQPWQCFILSSLFGWKRRKDGLRRFRDAYIEIPRKNAKSTLAAGIGLYMFAADGESGSEVYSGATSEKQAWEVFRPARLMAQNSDGFAEHYGVEVNAKNLVVLEHASRFEPVIGKPGDGASPHCAIVDEFHEHQTPDLYDTMLTGMGARSQPLLLCITTAGTDTSSPCYDKRLHICKVLEGTVAGESTFAIAYTIDKDDDWTDFKSWRKSNPNLGVSVSEDFLRDQLQEAMQRASKQNILKCKHLNVWSNARSAWINQVEWQRAARPELKIEDFKGKSCIVSVDLSQKTDICAVGITFFEVDADGKRRYTAFCRSFLPEDQIQDPVNAHYAAWEKSGWLEEHEGAEIDYGRIEEVLRSLNEDFNVVEVAFDPWHATDLRLSLQKQGVPVVDYIQRAQYLSPAMKEVGAALASGRLLHDGNPLLEWMMLNVVIKPDAKDEIFPRKEKPEYKIDGAVTLIMGVGRAMVVEVQKKGSVYAERGFFTL